MLGLAVLLREILLCEFFFLGSSVSIDWIADMLLATVLRPMTRLRVLPLATSRLEILDRRTVLVIRKGSG